MIKKLKIVSISKDRMVVDQTEFLDVKFELLNDLDEVIESLSLGFKLSDSKEYISDELGKYLTTRIQDEERSLENASFDEMHKNADEVIYDLEGSIIK